MFGTRKPSKPSKALTLAEYDAKCEAERRAIFSAQQLDALQRGAQSHVWDDPKNWK